MGDHIGEGAFPQHRKTHPRSFRLCVAQYPLVPLPLLLRLPLLFLPLLLPPLLTSKSSTVYFVYTQLCISHLLLVSIVIRIYLSGSLRLGQYLLTTIAYRS
jgi:hypothetical protein